MLRLTLRSVWEHKRRLVSTVLAIVLGVAFMSGTLVFADTVDQVFDDLFADANQDIDVVVRGEQLFDAAFGPPERATIDPSIVDEILAVEGVTGAAPYVDAIGFGSQNRVLTEDGDVLGPSNGPPTLLESWVVDESLNPYNLVDGVAPTEPSHVALNIAAATDAELAIGDTVGVLSQFGEQAYELVGTFRFGDADSAAGAITATFTLAEAQRIAGLGDAVERVVVTGSVEPDELVTRIQAAVGDDLDVLTAEAEAAETSANVQEGFAFFRQALLIFGGIALLVGTFIISNTFSILIAQRTRELALLRAIGASREQVVRSVSLEAIVTGLVAAVLGLVGGIALAQLLYVVLQATGSDFPTAGLILRPGTAVFALVVGLLVSTVASVIPAIKASRVPPLAALREVATGSQRASRIRSIAAVVVVALAVLFLSAAFRSGEDTDRLPVVGTGAFLLMVGAILIGPVVAEPTVRLLGSWLPSARGITGSLALENAARAPKRTAATASALLIGVALIGFITIFGESARTSIGSVLDQNFKADLAIQSSQVGFGPPGVFPATVADTVSAVDGVESITRFGFVEALVVDPDDPAFASRSFAVSFDPENIERVLEPDMAEGAITDLAVGGVVVDDRVADDRDLEIGDDIILVGPTGTELTLSVAAVSDDPFIDFYAITNEDQNRLVAERELVQIYVVTESGADIAAVQAELETALERIPSIDVLDRDGFIGTFQNQITGFLSIVQGLLGLSVIIALIGIANTLSLSIHERTRELGLLRAVGMSRAQVRAAVRWEAFLISVLGTAVGLVLGVAMSYCLVRALGSFGLERFAVPVPSIVTVGVFMAVLGVVAAIRPARRAAKLNVLDAIASE